MSNFPEELFMKSCIVKDGIIEFSHGDKEYKLTSECLTGLDGLTVLIDSGMNIFRSEKLIGKAVPIFN